MPAYLQRANAHYLLEADRELGVMLPDMEQRLRLGSFAYSDVAEYSELMDCCIKAANRALQGCLDPRGRYVHSLIPNVAPDFVCAKLHLFGKWPITPEQEREFQEKVDGGFDPAAFVRSNVRASKARYVKEQRKVDAARGLELLQNTGMAVGSPARADGNGKRQRVA